MPNFLSISLFFIGTYFLSSISFALIAGKLKHINLREVGSGNLGATNVYRALGLKYAVSVFVLDAAKGFLPTFIAMYLFENYVIHVAIGLVAILGHSLSIYVKFKGGKGVATGLGVVMALNPLVATILAIGGFGSIWITKYVAPVSIVCSIVAPILFYIFKSPIEYTLFICLIAGVIVLRHKDNIIRLIQGKENKL